MKNKSYGRFREDRGFKDIEDLPRGPSGKPLCRFCKKEVTEEKSAFCGPECIHQFKIQSSQGYMRKTVFERDRGVCNKCGLDTEKLKQILFRVKEEKGDLAYESLLQKYETHYGYSFSLDKHFWEADHITPVAHGGGSCGLDNLQSLCVPCHKKKTVAQLTKGWKRHYWRKKNN